MSAQRKDRAMGAGMEASDFYTLGRLRARVAELEVEVNLLHRQRHAAQEAAANARLLAEAHQLSQGEIDRLRARVAELEKQPRANELRALRDLFAAAGRTIHAASTGGRATLEEINDAWAEVCAAQVANRDLPAPDVVPVPREELEALNEAAAAGDALRETLYEYAEGNMVLPQLRRCDAANARLDALRAGEAGKIEMTYCGKDHQDAVGDWWRCGEAEGACPSCLRAHIAKLEAELATAQARIRETEERGVVVPEPEVPTLASLAAYSNPVDAVRATLKWVRKNATPSSHVAGGHRNGAANARLLAAVCHPTPDVVPVPKDELAVLRDGFGLLRTAWNLSLCGERIGAQAGALIERYDALRSGEAGKGREA